MDIKRTDSWLVKGFDGVTNLIIQRSQNPASKELVGVLEEALCNLEIVSGTVSMDLPTITADQQMFSLLLQLTKMLLARVRADKGFDRANIDALRGYMTTLRTALQRFRENEQCADRTEGLERHSEPPLLSVG